jgi:hypothetical protein
MDNDILINQARRLYSVLYVEQYTQDMKNKARFKRLDHAVMWAYCRYQRRLNRCVVCYQHRLKDCLRDLMENEHKFCSKRARVSAKEEADA